MQHCSDCLQTGVRWQFANDFKQPNFNNSKQFAKLKIYFSIEPNLICDSSALFEPSLIWPNTSGRSPIYRRLYRVANRSERIREFRLSSMSLNGRRLLSGAHWAQLRASTFRGLS